jgi:hypothetical protein
MTNISSGSHRTLSPQLSPIDSARKVDFGMLALDGSGESWEGDTLKLLAV